MTREEYTEYCNFKRMVNRYQHALISTTNFDEMTSNQFKTALQTEIMQQQSPSVIKEIGEHDTLETTIIFHCPISAELAAWLQQRFMNGVRQSNDVTYIINSPNNSNR